MNAGRCVACERVVKNPGSPDRDPDKAGQIEGVRPVFAGTRTPVEDVLSYVRRGLPDEDILLAFPDLAHCDVTMVRRMKDRPAVSPAVADLLKRTRQDRGLPATIEDEGVLEQIATLIDPTIEREVCVSDSTRRQVERSRREQGLPPKIEDPVALAKIVTIMFADD